MDTEDAGRLGLVEVGLLQCLTDGLGLGVGLDLPHGGVFLGGQNPHPGFQVERKVPVPDAVAFQGGQGPLQYIGELPDIARPAMLHQDLVGAFVESDIE